MNPKYDVSLYQRPFNSHNFFTSTIPNPATYARDLFDGKISGGIVVMASGNPIYKYAVIECLLSEYAGRKLYGHVENALEQMTAVIACTTDLSYISVFSDLVAVLAYAEGEYELIRDVLYRQKAFFERHSSYELSSVLKEIISGIQLGWSPEHYVKYMEQKVYGYYGTWMEEQQPSLA